MCLPALALLAGCGGDSEAEEDDGPDIGDKYSAAVMCEEFVKDRLKSPVSAEFDTENGERVKGAWRVTGTVDSENSFGALIRNDFTCVVKYAGDDEWRLQSLSGLDN